MNKSQLEMNDVGDKFTFNVNDVVCNAEMEVRDSLNFDFLR